MGNSGLKKAVKTFIILSAIFIIAYLGLAFGYYFTAANNKFADLGKNYVDALKLVPRAILYPFVNNNIVKPFADFYNNIAGVNPLIMSIALYVALGITFVLLVVGIIVVFVKHKGKFVWFFLIWLFVMYILAIGLAGEAAKFVFAFMDGLSNSSTLITGILSLAALVFAFLAFVFALIGYILVLKYVCSKPQPLEDVEAVFDTQEPVLAEENLAEEEQVEEPVAEVTQEYVPALEPEPAPEAEEVEEVVPIEEEVVEEPEEEVAEEEEKVEFVEPEPIPEPQPDETNNHVEVNVNNNPSPAPTPAPGIDPNSLASLLREVVRDIVRDEIARNNANQPQQVKDDNRGGNQNITGATFGGPLVVQYFNGGINGVNPPQQPVEIKAEPQPQPAPQPAVVEEKPVEPAKPVKEEIKEEVEEAKLVEEVQPEPAPAPAPVEVAPAPVVPVPEKEEKGYERLTFAERLLRSDKELLDLYNELKNEILSYGVKSRISSNGDTFRLHKKMYIKITVAGKSLKLYFALNPDDYRDSKIPVQDAGHKGLYADIPLVFKVRSGLSVRRCKELIQDTMEKDGLEQGEVEKINWAKELKAEISKKENKDSDED